jgi:surface protein
MSEMFTRNYKFNQDLSSWNVSKVKKMKDMFKSCQIEKNPPSWYHD